MKKLMVLPCFALTILAGSALSSFTYTEAEGPGYPSSRAALESQLALQDVPAIRSHGWEVWRAVTREADSGFPAFLTWYQADELFSDKPLSPDRTYRPSFNHPLQKTLGLGDAILSFNTYNQAMYDHIRGNGYQQKSTLRELASGESKVKDFPDESIMVKTVWWPVRSDGLTAFPVWDREPTRPIEWGRGIATRVERGEFDHHTADAREALRKSELHGNDFETFKRVVAVEPVESGLTSAKVLFFDPDDLTFEKRIEREAKRVPLDSFFHLKLESEDQVSKLNKLPDIDDITTMNWGRPLQVGDYLVLVAAHVSTREINDWVWATYWWHDQPDHDAGADRPGDIAGAWQHFKMNVAYHGEFPREPDGSPGIAYNPYLESGFSYGVQSNCVSCHQRAVLTKDGEMGEVFPLTRGQLAEDDAFFEDKLQLDFVWSLATRTK